MPSQPAILLLLALAPSWLAAAEIGVGPGKGFTRIEDAVALAQPGDTVAIHPRGDGSPYARTAVRITRPRITLRGVADGDGNLPVLDGSGASRAGAGGAPRAIIEFAAEAEGGMVAGLRLTHAHSASHDAAGVRIDGADGVTVAECAIDACDMGVLSTGAAAGEPPAMHRLTVRDCAIRGNGDPSDPGRSHNLCLAGSDARVVGCLIEGATTGHNLKSRLGTLLVEACVIRYAANRELDLVDAAGVTDQAGGFALVIGCLLLKDPACIGDKEVIQWGQDAGADRLGNLYLVHSTVVTPFAAPVVELSAPGAQVCLANDIICGPGAATDKRQLVARRGPGLAEPLSTAAVWLGANYAPAPKGPAVVLGAAGVPPPLRDPVHGDWRPATDAVAPLIDGAIPLAQLPLPVAALDSAHPLRQRPPVLLTFGGRGAVPRAMVGAGFDLGAFEGTPLP